MSVIKDLAEVPRDEQEKYLKSFDTVLLDMDGVIWVKYEPIKGAPECITNLKKIGKGVHYVTNNTLMITENLLGHLTKNEFGAKLSDITNPTETLVAYLKKVNVKGDIFLMGPKTTRNELKKNGFNLVPEPPSVIGEDLPSLAQQYEEKKVGAVVVDYDMNMSLIKLQNGYWYMKDNPDCLFLVTCKDKFAPIGPIGPGLVTHHFLEALKEISGREFTLMGKPSKTMVNHIKTKYNIQDPKRTLFVGDSIMADMSTASKGGFQKLLVLSGTDKIENIENWEYPEEYKPEYYVENLSVLNDIIKSIYL